MYLSLHEDIQSCVFVRICVRERYVIQWCKNDSCCQPQQKRREILLDCFWQSLGFSCHHWWSPFAPSSRGGKERTVITASSPASPPDVEVLSCNLHDATMAHDQQCFETVEEAPVWFLHFKCEKTKQMGFLPFLFAQGFRVCPFRGRIFSCFLSLVLVEMDVNLVRHSLWKKEMDLRDKRKKTSSTSFCIPRPCTTYSTR